MLLAEPLQRRSQGNAAVQAAAKIGNGMLTIAWEVFVIMVLEPALAHMTPRAQTQAVQAANKSNKAATESNTVPITADSSNSHVQASEAVPA